ncbi:hypothetical protein LTR78_005965 [Recurvomyces mirabilis]|uniref:Major facilitator superfamily (MFS) profile domain-containing protein n=1 Tax=Recurvomyces mirabilis TaxID=574656 RepID=A0AAE0WLV0_9PEZI|nr:hypothetical protein LTR78_005965 [Recurvomyces mirabilis]
MASVGTSVVLGGLDGTIVSTAIPSIVDDFHALGSIGWFGSVYFLTGASNIVWGKVYRYYPIKVDFLGAIALFELGSLICATSPNATALIVGRAIAGVGAAGLQAGGNIIIGFAASPKRRPIFLGMLGACYTISSALGPIIGGALTSKTTWRWCFWINLPIGGLAFAAVFLGYRTPEKSRSSIPASEKLRHLNPLTYVLWCAALICYLLALQYGGQTKSWSDPTVIGVLVGFVLLLGAGVAWDQWCGDNALLQRRLLRIRAIAAAAPFVFFLTGNYSIMIYFIPLYFQSVTGASAINSGIRTLALVLPLSIFALVAGGIIKKTGYYKPLLMLGSGMTALAAGLIYTWDVHTSIGCWIGYQILLGAGMGLSGQGSIIAAQAAVHYSDIATATATVLFFQTISGAFFISAANSVFANQLKRAIASRAPGVDSSILFGEGGAANLGELFSNQDLDNVLAAYLQALRSAYALALASGGLAFLFSFAAEWKKVNMDAIGKDGDDAKAVETVATDDERVDKDG